MADRDPKVTRRDTLRLATAVGALGAGLGVTLAAKDGIAAGTMNEVLYKEVVTEKIGIGQKELGSIEFKITYVKADGSQQLLHAFDLTSHFLKLEPGSMINFTVVNHKEQKMTPVLDRSFYVKMVAG